MSLTADHKASTIEPSPVYVASPKRFRRTKAAITSVRDAIKDILEHDNPQMVRQVFYALTVRGVIAKAEIEYQRTVVRLLVDMREAGDIPFDPTRPTKQSDTRAKKFGSATSVELDAIPARQLRAIVRECIERHVDRRQLEILRTAEESERELLKKWATTYGSGQ
jgi:hypothetical protein